MTPDFSEVSSESNAVYAAMDSPSLLVPPYVLLSYPGLEPPLELFDALGYLGWVVPPQPPPPSVLDGDRRATGGLAYRVDDCVLREGVWDQDVRQRIGAATFAILQRYGVRVNAPMAYERLLFPAQVDAGEPIDLRLPSDPPPHTIIIELAESSIAATCSYRVYRAHSLGHEGSLTWSERARQVGPAEEPVQRRVAEQALLAWQVEPDTVPVPTTGEQASLRLVVEDARRGIDLVDRLREVMGKRVSTCTLRPMAASATTVREGLLIMGVVERDRLDRIRTLLVEQNPLVTARLDLV